MYISHRPPLLDSSRKECGECGFIRVMPPKTGAKGGNIPYDTWKQELLGLHDFLNHMPARSASDQHVQHVMNRLHMVMALTPQEGVEAVQLLQSGPWNEIDKEKLTSAVSASLLGQSVSPSKSRPSQQVQSFSSYFTKKDIEILGDPQNSLATKIDCTWT